MNGKINLILTWSEKCAISFAVGETKFSITDIKLQVLVATLSAQDNAKLLEQLKAGFKRTINRYKYESRVSIERENQCLNF